MLSNTLSSILKTDTYIMYRLYMYSLYMDTYACFLEKSYTRNVLMEQYFVAKLSDFKKGEVVLLEACATRVYDLHNKNDTMILHDSTAGNMLPTLTYTSCVILTIVCLVLTPEITNSKIK